VSSAIRVSEPISFRDEQHLAGILWTVRALIKKENVQLALIDSNRKTVTMYTRVNSQAPVESGQ
jgi:hypothetical protein